MNREQIVLSLICQVWPILLPALVESAKNTNSPIDDWLIRLLDGAIRGICND